MSFLLVAPLLSDSHIINARSVTQDSTEVHQELGQLSLSLGLGTEIALLGLGTGTALPQGWGQLWPGWQLGGTQSLRLAMGAVVALLGRLGTPVPGVVTAMAVAAGLETPCP